MACSRAVAASSARGVVLGKAIPTSRVDADQGVSADRRERLLLMAKALRRGERIPRTNALCRHCWHCKHATAAKDAWIPVFATSVSHATERPG